MKFIQLFFAIIFLGLNSTSAQNQVSDIINIGHAESLSSDFNVSKLVWNDKIFLMTKSGSVLMLTEIDDLQSSPLSIDLGIECFHVLYYMKEVYGNTLYLNTENSVLEIDLQELIVTNQYLLDSEERIHTIKKDDNEGILVTFSGPINRPRLIARIDLDTDDITYRTIPASRSHLAFGNYIISYAYDSLSVIAYDLNTETENVILEGTSLGRVHTNINSDKIYISDSNSNLYEYNEYYELEIICSNYSIGKYDFGFINENFLYVHEPYNTNTNSSSLRIVELESCQTVQTVNISSDFNLRSIDSYKSKSSIIQFDQSLLQFHYDSFEITKYEYSTAFVIQNEIKDSHAYSISLKNEQFIIYKQDLEGNKIDTFYTNLSSNSFGNYPLPIISIADDQKISITTRINAKYTTTIYDSSFVEVESKVLSSPENLGLSPSNNLIFQSTDVPFVINNNRLLSLQEDELDYFNQERYYRGTFIIDDTAYGYINRNDSTFFTLSMKDSIIYEYAEEYLPIGTNTELFKAGNTVYRLFYNGIKSIYPYPSTQMEEIDYEIKEIHHQFSNKILATVEYENVEKLAIFDGQNFEIISDPEIIYFSLDETYHSYRTDETIKIFVFDIERGVDATSLILSFDVSTGEVYLNEKIDNMSLINRSMDQKDQAWKALLFNVRWGDEYELIATNGKQLKRIPFSDIMSEYGWSNFFMYSNDFVFYTHNGKSIAVSESLDVTELVYDDKELIIKDVQYVNEKYYIIRESEYKVELSVFDKEFQPQGILYEALLSPCHEFRGSHFLDLLDDNRLLMVLNTSEYGAELWQLSLSDNAVSLVSDINHGIANGYKNTEFFYNDKLYFIAKKEGNNTQLYSIEVEKGLLNSTNNTSISGSDLVIYPNPSSNTLFTNIPLKDVAITDIRGNSIWIPNPKTNNSKHLNIEHLPTGIYILSGHNEKGEIHRTKFCKY